MHVTACFLLIMGLCMRIISASNQVVAADDIPSNCENTTSPYMDPNAFVRYTHGNLSLIDWISGSTIATLEEDSPTSNFWLIGWSPDCHYLAGAFLQPDDRYTTMVWDVVNGMRLGTIEDGYRTPHHLTWSPRSDALVVETRNGAFLWNLAPNQRLQLTLDSLVGASFTSIVWNYETDTLDTLGYYTRPTRFSLITGRPVDVALADDQYAASRYGRVVMAPNEQSPYGCVGVRPLQSETNYDRADSMRYVDLLEASLRVMGNSLVVRDSNTSEILAVLDTDFSDAVRKNRAFGYLSASCDLFFTALRSGERNRTREGVVIRMRDGVRVHTIPNMPPNAVDELRYYDLSRLRSNWNGSGRYLLTQSYEGVQVWDSATNTAFYLTTADESAPYGYSVREIRWNTASGLIDITMFSTGEVRTFDLATGERIN